jgi:hypothetical protein
MVDRIAKFFCSLRLTVVLLCAGLVLVFVGTLAQVHEGLFAAQVRYFKSFYIWKPTIGDTTWPIILPGGYLIGGLLLVNLIAAHIKRFQFTWKKLGIHMIHGGLILLLLGQLLTDVFSQESMMEISEGGTRNYSEDFRADELVLIDSSDPKGDRVASIPESRLAAKGDIQDSSLPVTVRVRGYWVNCEVNEMPPPQAIPLTNDHGNWLDVAVLPLPAGDPAAESARAAVQIEILSTKGSLGTYLVAANDDPPTALDAGGHEYVMTMMYAPFLGGNNLIVSPPGQSPMEGIKFSETDLAKKTDLKDPGLPLTLRVKNFWPNCRIYRKFGPGSVQPNANRGALAGTFVTPMPPVTDTDHRNIPAVAVELVNAKGSLGTWLLWTAEGTHDRVQIDGKEYQMAFQFKRYYRPFSIGLLKFSHDKYKGTDIPKNFSSRIRLMNPATSEDREVTIKMNEPLRYAGTTYYQAGFKGEDTTRLEVVSNPSWLTPYLACILVGLGLIIQFMSHLIPFATKRRNA